MLRDLLMKFRKGEISLDDAEREISGLRIGLVSDIACLDLGRRTRCGIPEVVLAEGKEPAHLLEIAMSCVEATGHCIITRIPLDLGMTVRKEGEKKGINAVYNERGHVLVLTMGAPVPQTGGTVGIITAGTSDIKVAEEAKVIAEEMGCRVLTAYDVGAAGIHRLFPALQSLCEADVLIVAAGREGTLPSVVAGLVDLPVIGVPVSTGYGYMGEGMAALASMLQSCSVIAVVNIDSGFTAGAFAARIANMVVSK